MEPVSTKVKVNWPLRIGLFVIFFIMYALGHGFLKEIKEPLRKGVFAEAREDFRSQSSLTANDILLGISREEKARKVRAETEEKAARFYAVAVGLFYGALHFLFIGYGILAWRLTWKIVPKELDQIPLFQPDFQPKEQNPSPGFESTTEPKATSQEHMDMAALSMKRMTPELEQEAEEQFYETAWAEIENNETKKSLWARAYSECEGDAEKTKASYITHRVNELMALEQQVRLTRQAEEDARFAEERSKQEADGKAAPPLQARMEIGRDGRYIAYSNGTVLDTSTNLMWAANDNGSDVDWRDAKRYCENYRGGGYTDWRMPTQDELAGLYDNSKSYRATQRWCNVHLSELIELSAGCVWASEISSSNASDFNFEDGTQSWCYQSIVINGRALPVRLLNDEQLMQYYGITHDGESYSFRQYKYEHLSNAIDYAKLQKDHSY